MTDDPNDRESKPEPSDATTAAVEANPANEFLQQARERRARIRTKTQEILDRQSQMTAKTSFDLKELVLWGIALSLVVGLVYYSYLKYSE